MIRVAGYCENYTICSCRPTHVGRGLKLNVAYAMDLVSYGRPTHVGRGLKWQVNVDAVLVWMSPHACGAWIEVGHVPSVGPAQKVSPHACGAWIEVYCYGMVMISRCGRPTHVGRGLKSE